MPNYMLMYHGGKAPESPEEGEEHMAEWETWADELGSSLVNRGAPLGSPMLVTSSGVTADDSADPMIGYSILKAENIEVAVKLVDGSPHINHGGTMIVAEMIEMQSS